MFGQLFLIIGPSTDLTNTIVSQLENVTKNALQLYVPTCVISNIPPSDQNSQHYLSLPEFLHHIKTGAISIWWEEEGALYGIRSEFEQKLASGVNVLLPINRSTIVEIKERFPQAQVIVVSRDFSRDFYVTDDNTVLTIEAENIQGIVPQLIKTINKFVAQPKNISVTVFGNYQNSLLFNNESSSFIIHHSNGDFLIDVVPGLTQYYMDHHFDITKLLGIVITHDHIDRFDGLGAFLNNFRDSNIYLPIYAPIQTISTLRDYFSALKLKKISMAIKLQLNPVQLVNGSLIAELPGFNLTACPTFHIRDTIAIAIRDLSTGAKIVFGSETRPSEEMIKFAYQADILFHDCKGSYKYQPIFGDYHSSSMQAAQIAQTALVKRLALINFDYRYFSTVDELLKEAKAEYSGSIFLTRSGQKYIA